MGCLGPGLIAELLHVPGEGQARIAGRDSNLALGVKGRCSKSKKKTTKQEIDSFKKKSLGEKIFQPLFDL